MITLGDSVDVARDHEPSIREPEKRSSNVIMDAIRLRYR